MALRLFKVHNVTVTDGGEDTGSLPSDHDA